MSEGSGRHEHVLLEGAASVADGDAGPAPVTDPIADPVTGSVLPPLLDAVGVGISPRSKPSRRDGVEELPMGAAPFTSTRAASVGAFASQKHRIPDTLDAE